MLAKLIIQFVLFWWRIGIRLNGTNPWDPQVLDRRFYWHFLFRGSIGLGNSYVKKGWWRCEQLDVFFFKLLESAITDLFPKGGVMRIKRREAQKDMRDKVQSRRVSDVHYDDDPELFFSFLGSTRKYSCARWKGVSTLDEAQIQSMDLLFRKAKVERGQRVLEIGSGWGSTLAHGGEHFGIKGVGVSIAPNQIAASRKAYGHLPVEYRQQDYRDVEGKFDRVLSVGMIEHVGREYYREYFQKVRDVLPPDGLFVLQGILELTGIDTRDPWIEQEVWPGGMFVDTRVLREAARGILYVLDEEHFGPDYDKTCMAWRNNLQRNRDAIVAKYGIEKYRKYYYLFSACCGGFRAGRMTVGQLVLSPSDLRRTYKAVRLPL